MSRSPTQPFRGIGRLLVLSAWLVAILTVVLYGGTWLLVTRTALASQASAIRSESESEARSLIRSETERAIDYIGRLRADSRSRLEKLLSDRVDEAIAIARNIRQANRTRGDAEIGRLITDALRPIRFNDGRGYYFATRLDGVEILFADRPELEGRSLLEMTDTRGKPVIRDMISLVRADGGGYYTYTWTKPGVEGQDFPKLACVKLFEPMGWFIGTGEYLDDFERSLQQDVLAWLGSVRFGTDGYLFAGQWDGISLMGPAVGRNMIDTTDVNGVKVVEELIGAARRGGGFVSYTMPPLEGQRQLPKLSYVMPIVDWQWYVGGGQYLADIDQEIRTRQATSAAASFRQGAWLAAVLVLLLGGLITGAAMVARRIDGDFGVFDRFFREVALPGAGPRSLDGEHLRFAELRGLAVTVNRMLAERLAAEHERERLAAVVEQSTEAVAIMDAGAVVRYVNPAYERIMGWKPEEVIGQRPPSLRPGGAIETWLPQILADLDAGRSWTRQMTIARADGRMVTLELVFSPIRNVDARVTQIAMLSRDITEQVRLEGQLAQARKMEAMGQLAGGIAHDFNNLLQAIQGFTELAREELAPRHAAGDHLAQVLAASGRAGELVRQLLAFSRREAFHPQTLPPVALVEDFLKILRRLIGAHIDIVLLPEEGLPPVATDPAQFQQVLINLCVNSRDAMPRGGRILIAISAADLENPASLGHPQAQPGTYVRLDILDEGEGMPPEVIARVFEPFFTTKEVGRGTGLGLATVYGIVQQHRGLVELSSDVGRGTTVSVFLPAASRPAAGPGMPVTPAAAAGGGRTILLAEDEEQVRLLARRVLEKAGYRVIAAADGVEALRLFGEHGGGIDLALLDLVMPGMGGGALRERIRAVRPALPIIMATGYGRDQLPADFVPDAGERVLQKPWTAAGLLEAIAGLLGRAG